MSRKESEEKFLRSLEELLIEGKEIGVNALAEKTGLNKVLIYRYFGGLDGLLETFAKRINLWRSLREELEIGLVSNRWETGREVSRWLFRAYRRKLLESPLYLRILKEELFKPGPLTWKLEMEREVEGLAIMEMIAAQFPQMAAIDIPAAGAFIMSGLTYLALKSTQVDQFNGLDLSDDQAWKRFDIFWESAFDSISQES